MSRLRLWCLFVGCSPMAGIARDGVWCCRRCYNVNFSTVRR